MHRALRLLMSILCLLSLVVSAATVVLWARSYRVGETWHFEPTSAPATNAAPLPGKPDTWVYQYHLACGGGHVQLVRRNLATSDVRQHGYGTVHPPEQALVHLAPGGSTGGSGWRFAGFEYFHSSRRYVSTGGMTAWIWGFRILGVPLWLPVGLFGVPPLVWTVRRVRAGRGRRLGLCPGCGYDLRASRQFGRCPECGRETTLPSSTGERAADVVRPTPLS
jgi:hypothetical protein